MKPGKPRYCPSCGASQPLSAKNCGICGEPLPTAADLSALWGSPAYDDPTTDVVDLYSDSALVTSSQATTPIRLSQSYDSTAAEVGHPAVAVHPVEVDLPKSGPSGPPGWLLGLIGMLIIVGATLFFFYLVV